MIDNFYFPIAKLLDTGFVSLAIFLLLIVAYGDAKNRRIPNALVLAIAVLGVFRLMLIGNPTAVIYTVAVSLLVLFVTYLLFWRRFIGGGDAKLLIATALLIGYHDMVSFLAIMSIAGLLLSVVMLVIIWYSNAKSSVPYGVAIAAGAIVTLSLQTSIFIR